jgi:hypothetical protein
MKPGVKDITIQRGEDYSLSFSAKDKDGVAIIFTGATVYAQLREGPLTSDTLIADFVGSVPSANVVNILMDDATTAAVTQNYGYYDALVVDTGGTDRYYLRGRATIEGSSTVKP